METFYKILNYLPKSWIKEIDQIQLFTWWIWANECLNDSPTFDGCTGCKILCFPWTWKEPQLEILYLWNLCYLCFTSHIWLYPFVLCWWICAVPFMLVPFVIRIVLSVLKCTLPLPPLPSRIVYLTGQHNLWLCWKQASWTNKFDCFHNGFGLLRRALLTSLIMVVALRHYGWCGSTVP